MSRARHRILNPARDLAFIGARLDAELRRQHAPLLIQVAFVEADLHARERSQTAPPGPRTPPHLHPGSDRFNVRTGLTRPVAIRRVPNSSRRQHAFQHCAPVFTTGRDRP